MEDKEFLKITLRGVLSGIIFGVLFGGILVDWYHEKYGSEVPIIVTPPIDITPELEQIDSLNVIVSIQEEEIQRLHQELLNEKVIVVKEIERIKELPATENIELLSDNLLNFGELSDSTELPRLIQVPGEDSVRVSMSENNLKDVNIITAKYQGEVRNNEILTQELLADSLIISAKDSIIERSSIIIEKNQESYNLNLKSIQEGLERERKDKIKRTAILGASVAILTGVLVFK